MKAIKTLVGLIYDDARLVITLALALVLALMLRLAHQPLLAAMVIWLGLIIALWVSIEHELSKKQKS